jgi:hypothetical protein
MNKIKTTDKRKLHVFTTVFGIVPLADALLMSKNTLHRRVDVQEEAIVG